MIGIDMWNGSAQQVESFRSRTGIEFPLLLNGTRSEGGNIASLYGPYDNHVVIDSERRIRYRASDAWPHGNRYHLDEIRAAVDQALATPARATSWSSIKTAFAPR